MRGRAALARSPRLARALTAACCAALFLTLSACKLGGDGDPVAAELASGGATASARSILIECEDYASRTPEGPRIARRHDATWASGRTCLIGVNVADRVLWRFELPAGQATSERELWLRYAAKTPVTLTFRLDDRAPVTVTVEPTGALTGRSAWGWARLGDLRLAAGEHTLALDGAPLRPDCFVIREPGTDPPGPPPGAAPSAPEVTDELLAALAAAPHSAPPSWLRAHAELVLPAWYEAHRVGLHTRLAAGWHDKPAFTGAAAATAALGAPSLARHVKTMNAKLFWPSAAGSTIVSDPASDPASDLGSTAPWVDAHLAEHGRDPVAAMIERAHDQGLAFIAYYRHQEDRDLFRAHGDWAARDHAGRVIRTAGEPCLSLHSPYADVLLERFLELAARGADGIYLDESHQPPEGDWSEHARAAFRDATGLPAPGAPLMEDPLYRRYLAFCRDSVADEFARMRAALDAVRPGFVLMVSSHLRPSLLDPWPGARVAASGTVVKTEYGLGLRGRLRETLLRQAAEAGAPEGAEALGDELLTLGWALARDAGFGRPPHVWIAGIETAEARRAAAVAVVAHGGFANIDHPEATLPDADGFGPAFASAGAFGAALAGARPLRDVALHVPAAARDRRLPDEDAAVREALAPLVAAWRGLASSPVCLIHDDQIELGMFDGVRVLFLPAPDALSAAQRDAVARFRARGGAVARTQVELVDAVRALELGVSLRLPPGTRSTWFRSPEGGLLIALCNRPGWVLERRPRAPEPVSARLTLTGADATAFDALAGGELPTLREGDAVRVELPPFQDAALVRVLAR